VSDLPPPQPLTHARVLRIAVPIVLSSATVPLVGVVDTAVVGQIGLAAPIGAVGIGATILATLLWIFGFLRMGTTGLVGQAAGAEDQGEVSAILTRALMVAVAAGVLLVVLQPLLFAAAFALTPASQEVEALARVYVSIRIWSAPFAIAGFALTGWLVAMERTGGVLALQLIMNGVNIVLDLWFVLGLGFGIAGVAWATVIAEVTGALAGLWLCRTAFAGAAWRAWDRVFDRAKMIRMALISNDILLRSAALIAIFTSFTFLGAQFGDATLAANQVLMQFLTLSAFTLDGFAYTSETLVARAVGRRDVGRLRRAAWLCTQWGLGSSVVIAVAFWFFGAALVDLMTTSPEVRDEARRYLLWAAASPVFAVMAFMLDGIFLGATRGPDLRNMMLVSLLIYVAAVLALMPFGNHGLWAALMISLLARAGTLALRYPALERAV